MLRLYIISAVWMKYDCGALVGWYWQERAEVLATLSTTNTIWTDLRLNLGVNGERLVTDLPRMWSFVVHNWRLFVCPTAEVDVKKKASLCSKVDEYIRRAEDLKMIVYATEDARNESQIQNYPKMRKFDSDELRM